MRTASEDPYAEGRGQAELPSRRARRQARLRKDILKAAAAVVAEQGYHGASLELIAERLDIAKATLCYYFASKDAVIDACLATCAQFVTTRLRAVADGGRPAPERLRQLILEQLTITTQDYPEMSRLFLYPLDWAPDLALRIRERQDEHSVIFRRVIQEGVATGDVLAPDTTLLLVCLHGAMNQVLRWLAGRRRSLPRSDELGRIADLTMRLLTP